MKNLFVILKSVIMLLVVSKKKIRCKQWMRSSYLGSVFNDFCKTNVSIDCELCVDEGTQIDVEWNQN